MTKIYQIYGRGRRTRIWFGCLLDNRGTYAVGEFEWEDASGTSIACLCLTSDAFRMFSIETSFFLELARMGSGNPQVDDILRLLKKHGFKATIGEKNDGISPAL